VPLGPSSLKSGSMVDPIKSFPSLSFVTSQNLVAVDRIVYVDVRKWLLSAPPKNYAPTTSIDFYGRSITLDLM